MGFLIVFVIQGFRHIEVRHIEVLFHTFYCNFGQAEEYRSLYTEDFVI